VLEWRTQATSNSQVSVRSSVCLSVSSIDSQQAAATCSWFAADLIKLVLVCCVVVFGLEILHRGWQVSGVSGERAE